MFAFFLIVLTLVPLTMIVLGSKWKTSPPKDINCIYGYRTTMSMKNKETWNFAHKYIGRLWFYVGIPLGILSIVALFVFINSDTNSMSNIVLVITAIQLIAFILPFLPTEIALKNYFDVNSMKK